MAMTTIPVPAMSPLHPPRASRIDARMAELQADLPLLRWRRGLHHADAIVGVDPTTERRIAHLVCEGTAHALVEGLGPLESWRINILDSFRGERFVLDPAQSLAAVVAGAVVQALCDLNDGDEALRLLALVDTLRNGDSSSFDFDA
jgi:hypothetical protein